MTFEGLKQYLLSKSGAAIDYPFGDDVIVLKVKGKMFALVGIMEWKGTPTTMLNLKCDPDESAVFRSGQCRWPPRQRRQPSTSVQLWHGLPPVGDLWPLLAQVSHPMCQPG